MRISVNSPLRDPHHRLVLLPPSMLAGVGRGGYWSPPPPPPPPGFGPLPNPPIFWSPQPPAPLYGSPSMLAFQPFFHTQRPTTPEPTTGHWIPRPRPLPSRRESSVASIVGQKRRRERWPGTCRTQNKALLRRTSKWSPSSVTTPKAPCAGDSTVSSSNVPLIVLKNKLSRIKSANRKTIEKNACMGDSEIASNAPLNMLKMKIIQTIKAKRKAHLETSALETAMSIARDNSMKDTSTTNLSQNVREEQIQAQGFVDQLRTKGINRKFVSTTKAPCAGDSTVSSSKVPLNRLKAKLSHIKGAKRKTREITACMGDSGISSNAPLNMLISKMVKTRKAKRKAQLKTSAREATMAIEQENSLEDVYEEEIQPQAFVDPPAETEVSNGKFVVEQAQQINRTGETEKEVSSNGNQDGPTETDDIVAEIMQHNPHVLETPSAGILLSDTNEITVMPNLDEMMNEYMTRESNREVERRETRPSLPGCQSTTTCLLNRACEFEEDASHLGLTVKVGQYSVDPGVSPILLDAIINKYGDIAKDCIYESESARSTLLESICMVLQGLQVPAKHLKPLDFKNYHQTVKNADKLGVNVKWLLERFDKHLSALGRCKDLRDDRKNNTELRDTIKKAAEVKKVKVKVKERELEIHELENQLGAEISEIKRLTAFASKIKFFRDSGLMGGLL